MKKKNGKNFTAILATIVVERSTQKGILIGKKGSMLKTIGQSKINMSKLIDGSVHLELFVKVVQIEKKESRLIEFGYEEDLNEQSKFDVITLFPKF